MSHPLEDGLPPGVVLGDYVIERPIGQGGFGITYLAHDTVFDRPVAVKEFLPVDVARRLDGRRVGPRSVQFRESFDWGLKEFLEEAKMIDRLDHPNVVRVRSFFRENDTAYLVMEYIEGRTLAVWLEEHETLDAPDLTALLRPLVAGLEHVHGAHCLHRDIKPDNIILRGDRLECPVLIDFGSARKAVAERTRSVSAVVSAGYTPLEQYSSHRTLTVATDLYSLCAVAYRCITAEEPPAATDRAIAETLPKLVERASGRYRNDLLRALDDGLALRVTDRPQNLSSVREALRSESVPTIHEAPPELPAVVARSVERDRNRRTMKVNFSEDPAADSSKLPSGADTAKKMSATNAVYPSPFTVSVLALIIGAAAYMYRPSIALFGMSPFTPPVVAFPFAAYAGTWLAQRWLARAGSSLLWRTVLVVVTYATVALTWAILIDMMWVVIQLAKYESVVGLLTFPVFLLWYLLFSPTSAALGALLIGLHVLTPRLRWLAASPGKPPLYTKAALFPALLLLAFAGFELKSFSDVRATYIASKLPAELRRVGYLRGGDDQLATVILSIEKQGVASDPAHVAVYEWARQGETRVIYTVAKDGSGDFTTITDALAHIDRLATNDITKRTEIRVKPGLYPENVHVGTGVRLIGEGMPTVQAPDAETAFEIPNQYHGLIFTDEPWKPSPSQIPTVVEGFRILGRITVAGESLAEIRGNSFGEWRDVAIVATDHANVLADKNVFETDTGGYALRTRGYAQVDLQGGVIDARELTVDASDESQVSIKDIEVRGKYCLVAAATSIVTIENVHFACDSSYLDARDKSRVTLRNSVFWSAGLGADPAKYVVDADGTHIALGDTVVKPR